MIARRYGRVVISCDVACDEEIEGDKGEEFSVVWDRAKALGWRSRKIGDEWVHGCPRCATRLPAVKQPRKFMNG